MSIKQVKGFLRVATRAREEGFKGLIMTVKNARGVC